MRLSWEGDEIILRLADLELGNFFHPYGSQRLLHWLINLGASFGDQPQGPSSLWRWWPKLDGAGDRA